MSQLRFVSFYYFVHNQTRHTIEQVMGDALSTLTPEEKRILQHPQAGEASELYWACRDGDVRRVRELLKTIPYEDLNRLELNGSTALHAASHGGHAEIVSILLNERGCRRDRPNLHGLTAYEEAQTQQIRQLFHRAGGKNRFCDENEQNSLALFKSSKSNGLKDDYSLKEDFTRDDYLSGHATAEDIEKVRKDQGILKMRTQSTLMKLVMGDKVLAEDLHGNREDLRELLDSYIPDNHREKEKSLSLVERAFEEKNPVHLLRLYTLETPFYRKLSWYDNEFLDPLNYLLVKAKSRYFKGTSYRGLKMSIKDLCPYQWSLEKRAAIETKTFCSTSLHRRVAEAFAESPTAENNQRKILMVFEFPKRTEHAINLGKISNNQPCISEYEDEAEVLVLPETLFFVKQIDTNSNYITISLEHIFVKRTSIFGLVKDTIIDEHKKE